MKNNNVMLQGATKLSKQEMKNVKGGSGYCDRLQEWANTHYDESVPDEYWDLWADYWLEHCS